MSAKARLIRGAPSRRPTSPLQPRNPTPQLTTGHASPARQSRAVLGCADGSSGWRGFTSQPLADGHSGPRRRGVPVRIVYRDSWSRTRRRAPAIHLFRVPPERRVGRRVTPASSHLRSLGVTPASALGAVEGAVSPPAEGASLGAARSWGQQRGADASRGGSCSDAAAPSSLLQVDHLDSATQDDPQGFLARGTRWLERSRS